MSLVVQCDTGGLGLDDIFRLISGVDVDGNIYIRVCDDETPAEDLTNISCTDFGVSALDILRGALFLNDDGEYCLSVSTAISSTLLNYIVAYYNFDEAAGNLIDQVGSLDGALVGPPTQGVAGIINDCYTFGGADYTTMGDSPLSGEDFSFSVWVKPDVSAANRTIIGWVSNGGPQFIIHSTDVALLVQQNVAVIGLSTTTVTEEAWNHIVVTHNTSGNYNFYINGGLAEGGVNDVVLTFSNMYIGCKAGPAELFAGEIDEVGIWNRVLTAGEAAELWNAGVGITYPF